MSELLQVLVDWHVLDPVPLPGQRTPVYVPFEELLGVPFERSLASAFERGGRTAVVGPIGSGKSSAIEFSIERSSKRLAPLWVSAAHEGRDTLVDPTEFARHMIRQIVRWARDAGAMNADERQAALAVSALRHAAATERRSTSVGLKLALHWLEPQWVSEVERVLADPEVDRLRSDFIDSLDRLVHLIYDRGYSPLVVVDDFDRWVNTTAADPRPVLDSFFQNTCRMLAERNWAVALAIQPEYSASATFRRAAEQGFLGEQHEIPTLPSSVELKTIFHQRIVRAVASENEVRRSDGRPPLPDAGIDDAFEQGFEDQLFERYESDSNLRPVFSIADQALRETLAVGDDVVTRAALAEIAVAIRV